MKAIEGVVSGRVQGVGFRQFVYEHAVQRALVGYVKNTPDGRVVFLLQGEDASIAEMQSLVRLGPEFARVDSCESECVPLSEGLQSFEILF